VAREQGLVDQTLRNWVKAAKKGRLNAPGGKGGSAEQMELSRVRSENARLRMENEILKKATADSAGQCYTIYFNLDFEGGVYGTNEATRTVCFPEGGAVAKVEKWAVFERYRSCAV
jgi:hypothetical protein